MLASIKQLQVSLHSQLQSIQDTLNPLFQNAPNEACQATSAVIELDIFLTDELERIKATMRTFCLPGHYRTAGPSQPGPSNANGRTATPVRDISLTNRELNPEAPEFHPAATLARGATTAAAREAYHPSPFWSSSEEDIAHVPMSPAPPMAPAVPLPPAQISTRAIDGASTAGAASVTGTWVGDGTTLQYTPTTGQPEDSSFSTAKDEFIPDYMETSQSDILSQIGMADPSVGATA